MVRCKAGEVLRSEAYFMYAAVIRAIHGPHPSGASHLTVDASKSSVLRICDEGRSRTPQMGVFEHPARLPLPGWRCLEY